MSEPFDKPDFWNMVGNQMKSRWASMGLALIAVSATTTINLAFAQKSGGTLYALHSPPNGSCPGLDWHITVSGNDLEGFVAASRSKRMWRLDGKVIPATAGTERSFEMEADEVGGQNRKAMIRGTAAGEYLNATITGAGTACDGKMIAIPRALNGIEGGGG